MLINTPDWIFPETRNNIVSMINYVADQYFDEHGHMEIDVTVGESKNFGGLATVIDDEEDFPIQFEIDLEQELLFDHKELMTTVAHEMVHIKQFATGELRNCPRSIKYRNKYYRMKDGQIDLTKYRDYPWEIEAYESEVTLYNNWASHNK